MQPYGLSGHNSKSLWFAVPLSVPSVCRSQCASASVVVPHLLCVFPSCLVPTASQGRNNSCVPGGLSFVNTGPTPLRCKLLVTGQWAQDDLDYGGMQGMEAAGSSTREHSTPNPLGVPGYQMEDRLWMSQASPSCYCSFQHSRYNTGKHRVRVARFPQRGGPSGDEE